MCHWIKQNGVSMPARLTINDMRSVAAERGGTCLSRSYQNSTTKLKWRCAVGHQWEAIPSNVRKGHWCPYCARQGKPTIGQLASLAESRGGKCLSTQYDNSKAKLLWQCAEGHVWEAPAGGIKAGHWCPECTRGVSERICRIFFEQIFKNPFPKVRPRWLMSPQGTLFELDGYCEQLQMAFEHHGEQHFGRIGFYADENASRMLQNRDNAKRKLCSQHGVILIEIPQIGYRVKMADLREFIMTQCIRHPRLKPLLQEAPAHIDYSAAYLPSSRSLFQEIQDIAAAKGGTCLSQQYKGAFAKLKWRCAKGHVWQTTPTAVKQGKWCWKCSYQVRSDNLRMDRSKLSDLAAKHGGRCLSTQYKTAHDILEWQCSEGHTWRARANDIQQGKWCPACWSRRRHQNLERRIALALAVAKTHGGQCLSTSFDPPRYTASWRCAAGHEWLARLHQIALGAWCRKCVRATMMEIRR